MLLRPHERIEFFRILTKLAIGVIGLLVVRLIFVNLPMLRDGGPVLWRALTALDGSKVAIDSIILVVIVNFGREIHSYLRARLPHFPASGTIAVNLILLVGVGIAYVSFRKLGYVLLSEQTYQWIFLGLAIIPLIYVLALFYQNMDQMAILLVRRFQIGRRLARWGNGQQQPVGQRLVCPSCGTEIEAGDPFCGNCGANLKATGARGPETAHQTCPNCNAPVRSGAKFCRDCGAALSTC